APVTPRINMGSSHHLPSSPRPGQCAGRKWRNAPERRPDTDRPWGEGTPAPAIVHPRQAKTPAEANLHGRSIQRSYYDSVVVVTVTVSPRATAVLLPALPRAAAPTRRLCRWIQPDDVLGLEPLFGLHHIELHLLAFVENL